MNSSRGSSSCGSRRFLCGLLGVLAWTTGALVLDNGSGEGGYIGGHAEAMQALRWATSRTSRRNVAFGLQAHSQSAEQLLPPIARRNEQRVIYAGVLPSEDQYANSPEASNVDPRVPRQAETSEEPLLDPPVALSNPYGWLRDDNRQNLEVINHLHAENNYTHQQTKHLQSLREDLYNELLSSIKETDFTLPRPMGDFWYYSRTIEGQSYPLHCRAPIPSPGADHTTLSQLLALWDGSPTSPVLPNESIYLDENQLAKNQHYCAVESLEISPSQSLFAYAVDFVGEEIYELRVQSMDTGETLWKDRANAFIDNLAGTDEEPDDSVALEIAEELVWGINDSTLFYLKMDDTQRPYQVFCKFLDLDKEDQLIFEESDVLFWVGIGKSMDGKYLFIQSSSAETSEVHYMDLHPNQMPTLQCITKRRLKVLYDVEHRNGEWWITSNVGGTPNLQLLKAPALPL